MVIEDEGIILSLRKFGEGSYIANCFLREHGVKSGMVRRSSGKKRYSDGLSPGNIVHAIWQARLTEHLGQYKLEVQSNIAVSAHQSRIGLYVINAVLAWLNHLLPISDPEPILYDCTVSLLNTIGSNDTVTLMRSYIQFELQLLRYIGHPLDLNSCAATGQTHDLVFVSPKSGRAVSADAGMVYRDKLLQLPNFMVEHTIAATLQDIYVGLNLTYFFLERFLADHYGKRPPQARLLLVDGLHQAC